MLQQEATLLGSIDHVKDFAISLLAAGAQCAPNRNRLPVVGPLRRRQNLARRQISRQACIEKQVCTDEKPEHQKPWFHMLEKDHSI